MGDAENIPMKDASIDFVVARSVLSYTDPENVIREVQRVLKPDGIFVIAEKVLGDYDGAAAAWYAEIETIRNPLKSPAVTTSYLQSKLKREGWTVLSAVELRRTYQQRLEVWLSRSGSIPREKRDSLARLVGQPPDEARAIGFHSDGRNITMPLSWAVLAGRPNVNRPAPSLVVSVLPVKRLGNDLYVYVQERRASGATEPEFFGFLEFPQGHVESDETIEDAARRELKEEAGLVVGRFLPEPGFPSVFDASANFEIESLHPSQVVVTRGRLNFVSLLLVAEIIHEHSPTSAVDNRGRWVVEAALPQLIKESNVYPLNIPMVSEIKQRLRGVRDSWGIVEH
ncbi:8-oxo-dGTP pyrophosphatase MutT (NUDIX family) [Nocardia kruczakiae]|uniref:8-oxo-dGTP pyrophosphatase MutT (NUDIX family) n=1 Tax=Nocardia kruczakiae TaxID=261477 RepID=A0ABU1XQK6_9NOCA|nr:8-oxo-dGTP pyrophosphatase MutT (NUDIX family) [Nocardia kruczakiae]